MTLKTWTAYVVRKLANNQGACDILCAPYIKPFIFRAVFHQNRAGSISRGRLQFSPVNTKQRTNTRLGGKASLLIDFDEPWQGNVAMELSYGSIVINHAVVKSFIF